jgi:hypothetical protein
MKRIVPIVLLCLALAACGLPPPRSAEDIETDKEFTAKFGLPGMVPLEPEHPRGALERAANKIFGDPAEKPKPVILPPAVPPAKIEPVARKPRFLVAQWQPSTWEWDGHQFVWTLGAWVQPPPGMVWQNGDWVKNELGDWVWRTGGWVPAS